jgi:chaperonin GroES
LSVLAPLARGVKLLDTPYAIAVKSPLAVTVSVCQNITKSHEVFCMEETRMNIRPLGDKVVVKPAEAEEKSAGGIILPDAAKQKPQEGTVIAVGTGRVLDNGERNQLSVKVGDMVVYSKYGGTEFKLGGDTVMILDEDQIYAIKG